MELSLLNLINRGSLQMYSFNKKLAVACCTDNPQNAIYSVIKDNYIIESNDFKYLIPHLFEMMDIYFPIKSNDLFLIMLNDSNYEEIFWFILGKIRTKRKSEISKILSIDIEVALKDYNEYGEII